MTNYITAIVLGVCLLALTGVVYQGSQNYVANQTSLVKAQEDMVKNEAIDGCLQAARVQEESKAGTATTPENYWYEFCMKQKGYK